MIQPLWRTIWRFLKKQKIGDFTGGTVVENPPANAGDTGSDPWKPQVSTLEGLFLGPGIQQPRGNGPNVVCMFVF